MRLRPSLFAALLALLAATAQAEPPPRFRPGAVWHQDIRDAPLHPDSAAMVATWVGLGGFGYGRMQIDFSFHVVRAGDDAPLRTILAYPSAGSYYSPDCEAPGTAMPVPVDAAIEGQDGLACDNANGDCHLLVVQGPRLYEAYRANASGAGGLQAQCLATWRLDQVYPASNRGEHCTSADAAGFPIAPLLFNADEVQAAMQVPDGDLGHAIRFILPNARMATTLVGGVRRPVYVRPASHAGGPSGPEGTIPYGARLRLRADFPVGLYPPAAQVILRTMQRYGIVLSDGGNIALTAESDRYTDHTWASLGITSRVFDQAVPAAPVRAQDFQVLDTGPRIVETYDCVRNAEPSDPRGLTARTARRPPDRLELTHLAWQDGAARVDVFAGTTFIATVDNTGRFSAKPRPRGTPWRVCSADTSACSEAVVPMPDRYLHAPERPRRRSTGRVQP
jgi:serine/threonine-protein kinase